MKGTNDERLLRGVGVTRSVVWNAAEGAWTIRRPTRCHHWSARFGARGDLLGVPRIAT